MLSVQQLYRISTMYWDDRYNTETVAHEVRSSELDNLGCCNLGAERTLSSTLKALMAHATVVPMCPVASWQTHAGSADSGIWLQWRKVRQETCLLPTSQVLARMKQLMVDNNTAASHSFLLDDDSSIPFSLDDIAALMEDKVLH